MLIFTCSRADGVGSKKRSALLLLLLLHEGPQRRVVQGSLGGDGSRLQHTDAVLQREGSVLCVEQ